MPVTKKIRVFLTVVFLSPVHASSAWERNKRNESTTHNIFISQVPCWGKTGSCSGSLFGFYYHRDKGRVNGSRVIGASDQPYTFFNYIVFFSSIAVRATCDMDVSRALDVFLSRFFIFIVGMPFNPLSKAIGDNLSRLIRCSFDTFLTPNAKKVVL